MLCSLVGASEKDGKLDCSRFEEQGGFDSQMFGTHVCHPEGGKSAADLFLKNQSLLKSSREQFDKRTHVNFIGELELRNTHLI